MGPAGTHGCRAGDVCVHALSGVLRCVRGCQQLRDCHGTACLPVTPGDPSANVCNFRGVAGYLEPCSSHYDCEVGGCNAQGVCAPLCEASYQCGRWLADLGFTGEYVCQDEVCTPANP